MHSNNKKIAWQIFFVSIMLGIIILFFALFVKTNRERIELQNANYVKDATMQSAQRIDEILNSAQAGINTIAALYGETLESPEVDIMDLQILAERYPFDYIEFVDKDGVDISAGGRMVNVSDRTYFQDGMRGNTGMDVIFDSRIDDENLVVFYAPLRYQGEIIGVLTGHYRESQMEDILASSFFGERTRTFLFLNDGRIIACYTDGAKPKMIFDDPQYGEIAPEVLEELLEAFRNVESYGFTYTVEDRTGNAYMMELPECKWMILQAFPASITNGMIDSANSAGMILLAELTALFALYIIFLLIWNWKQRKKLLLEKQKMSYVVDGITQLFGAFVLVDFSQDTYQYMAGTKPMRSKIPLSGRYPVLREYILSMLVEEEEKERIRQLLLKEELQNRLGTHTPYLRYEYQINRGMARWENLDLICLERINGVPVKILFTYQDVTNIKEEELRSHEALKEAYRAVENANHAKSDFLSNMFHDIRTPMNAIMGMTEIAAMHIDDKERVKDCLNKITASSRHLLRLINSVLDMSKIESGKVSLSEEKFSLTKLVEDVMAIFIPQVDTRNQQLEVSTEDIVHENVIGDSMRLQQVFVNILGNAVKFTPEGGKITLGICEKTSDIPGSGCYEFTFEDSGIGMSEEFVSQVFEPFARANNRRIGKIEGTGLGMSIAKNIVQMMNGDITVQSKVGIGTKFTVTVYLKLSDVTEEENADWKNKSAIEELQEKDYSGKRVLLVEDNEINMEIAEELLGSVGILIDKAYNGRQAVERVNHMPEGYYNLIFMDIQMPEMNGYEATEQIRASQREDLQKLPVVAMSADAFTEDVRHAKQVGMNDHISKPIEIEKLIKMLEKWI